MTGHISYRGTISYRHDRHGETGREWFTVTTMPGGERTIRALCEMDDLSLLRDVTFTVGPDFAPRDAFNRLSLNNRFAGSTWFRFDGNRVECEGLIAEQGRVSQSLTLAHRTPVFACHPLYVDGWHAAAFDHARGERVQLLEECTNSSMKLDGSTAPLLNVVRKKLEYVGREPITVGAGTFEADHYRIHPLRADTPDWTPLDLWTHGPELVFVKLRWDMIESTYELVELDAPDEVARRTGSAGIAA